MAPPILYQRVLQSTLELSQLPRRLDRLSLECTRDCDVPRACVVFQLPALEPSHGGQRRRLGAVYERRVQHAFAHGAPEERVVLFGDTEIAADGQ